MTESMHSFSNASKDREAMRVQKALIGRPRHNATERAFCKGEAPKKQSSGGFIASQLRNTGRCTPRHPSWPIDVQDGKADHGHGGRPGLTHRSRAASRIDYARHGQQHLLAAVPLPLAQPAPRAPSPDLHAPPPAAAALEAQHSPGAHPRSHPRHLSPDPRRGLAAPLHQKHLPRAPVPPDVLSRLREDYPPVREAAAVSRIRRFRLVIRLDCDVLFSREAAAGALSHMDEVVVDVSQAVFLGAGRENLRVLEDVRGVGRAVIRGSTTGFERYVDWLTGVMEAEKGYVADTRDYKARRWENKSRNIYSNKSSG
ncbi:hypothetical protein MHUMG1_07012 [Metarhizium humberi]|uniref:Uncharacterized protein n=1 Tax=Metarhizium humberi TaxID=2596975 RepID=A0A9P8S6F7_9HYPO|nr:hypothetical protein MHUMG1_07012 [Metarhizium humberi]